ncbi:MAG TPA: DHH family phosphoesterase [Candidatus Saccharimonadales bacterium]|nr:DHH family phosphoesterase [Candidatus Saccharimonadales bacterium]
MSIYPENSKIKALIDDSKHVVIMQADNPDGDSLASALALDQILGELGKEITLYCGVNIPSYLTYLKGWDRVTKELPKQFDLSIIVDVSAISLFENLQKSGQLGWVAAKPSIIIDHHAVDVSILFATVICNKPAVATGEVIYELGEQLKWKLNHTAKEFLAISILSDSLGLISEGTSARSIHIIAELVENGVKLAELENARREMMRKSIELTRYKGKLLERIEYFDDNRIATITIPWSEIEKYSHAYNPSMLVIDDMRLTEGTDVAIAFKVYHDGKVTAKIRCNYGRTIANDLAGHFGGGGHPYASGFKITDGRKFEDIKSETIAKASELLDKLDK